MEQTNRIQNKIKAIKASIDEQNNNIDFNRDMYNRTVRVLRSDKYAKIGADILDLLSNSYEFGSKDWIKQYNIYSNMKIYKLNLDIDISDLSDSKYISIYTQNKNFIVFKGLPSYYENVAYNNINLIENKCAMVQYILFLDECKETFDIIDYTYNTY